MKPSLRITVGRIALGLLVGAAGWAQTGSLPDGGFLTGGGWRVKPAGTIIPLDTLPLASVVTPDKKFLLVLNGGLNPPSVSVIELASAKELSRTPVPDGWLGLIVTKAGDKVYVGGGSRAAIYEFTLANGVLKPSRIFPVVAEKDRKPEDFIGDVRLSPDGRLLYAAELYRDAVVVLNPQSGLVLSRVKTGRRPYRILFHPSGKSFYVSSWADGAVGQYDAASGNRIANVRVGAHTTDMVWRNGAVEDHPGVAARLFVAASNTNSVYTLGATESGELSRLETISLAWSRRQPLGLTPAGLGLSADGDKLFVACSDVNAAAVVDISGALSRTAGFIPAGRYPTAAFGLPDGRVGVVNGYGPGTLTGSVQLLASPDAAALAAYTKEVYANSPYSDAKLDDPGTPAGNPVRANGPIKHVVYIVKSTAAAADKLVPGFPILENYYADSDAAADGGNWVTAALAPDYTRRLWQSSAAKRRDRFDFEGEEPAASPPTGYLWTNASQAGITLINYGFFVDNLAKPAADGAQLANVRDPVLVKNTEENFRGADPAYPDAERAKAFVQSLADFEKAGALPGLLLVKLDDDQALGAVVTALSKSRFWNETAVFITSAAPDSGGRALGQVISPWVKPWVTDRARYSQMSMLRTIEIILGLHPMTVYDAGATPMFSLFGNTPAR